MMSILWRLRHYWGEKKAWIIFWFSAVLVVLVSFGFGYFIGRGEPTPIIIEKIGQ